MAIPKFGPLENASEGTKKIVKPLLIGVIALLLGAFGLTASNNDWDLGSILSGQSASESKIQTDQDGNLRQDTDGDFMTRVKRDKAGNVIPNGQEGGKYADEYNCEDFTTQSEAQTFLRNSGGVKADVNRLDGDNDGQACESLPTGTGN